MHDPWTDRLSEYLDGELEPAEAAGLEEHLQSCGECRAVLDELRRVVQQAGELPDREVPDRVWDRVAREIQEEPGGRRVRRAAGSPARRRTIQLPLSQLIAAGLAVVMVSGALGWFLRPLPSPAPQSAASAPVLAEGMGPDSGFETAAVKV